MKVEKTTNVGIFPTAQAAELLTMPADNQEVGLCGDFIYDCRHFTQ